MLVIILDRPNLKVDAMEEEQKEKEGGNVAKKQMQAQVEEEFQAVSMATKMEKLTGKEKLTLVRETQAEAIAES